MNSFNVGNLSVYVGQTDLHLLDLIGILQYTMWTCNGSREDVCKNANSVGDSFEEHNSQLACLLFSIDDFDVLSDFMSSLTACKFDEQSDENGFILIRLDQSDETTMSLAILKIVRFHPRSNMLDTENHYRSIELN